MDNTTTIFDKNSQNSWLNICKGIAIFLVVYGHCLAPAGVSNKIIYSFHMPFFFLIGGYLFNYEKYTTSWKFFCWQKFKRLMFPYFICCILFFLHWFTFECPNPIKDTPFSAIKNIFFRAVLGWFYGIGAPNVYKPLDVESIGSLWFLPAYFIGINLLYFIVKFLSNKKILLSLFLIVSTIIGRKISKYIYLPWSIDIAFVSLIFFYAGYLLKTSSLFRKIKSSYFIQFVLLIIWILAIKYSIISLNSRVYKHLALAILGALSGSVWMMLIADKINSYLPRISKIFVVLGINSLIILCFHLRLQYLLPKTSWLTYWSIVEAIYLTLYSLIIAIVLQKIPGLNIIFFPKKKKNPAG